MHNPITSPQLEDFHTRLRAAEIGIDFMDAHADVEPLSRMIAAAVVFKLDAEDHGLDVVEAFKQVFATLYPNHQETA